MHEIKHVTEGVGDWRMLMRYVQINTVPNGSTGEVVFREQERRLAAGDECWAMWGRGRAAANDHELNFGTKAGACADAALTRLDDRAGFHSKAATRRLLDKLDEIDPDVVHLHNLHGYYINVEMLFRWLVKRGQSTVWTLHDCWSFTGHCSYFTYVKCEQWKDHCSYEFKCPQKGEYPRSCLLDSSKRNFDDKRRIFTSLPADRLTIVTPSQWLAGLVGQSFLSKYPVEVRRNEVDRTVFKPTPSDFRERYGIGDRFMILGVASPWTKRKGLDDFIRLARELDDSYAVVLVGLSKKQIRQVSKDVVAIPRTESKSELAEAYTAADLFVNPSIEETFGMTVAEAEACGTRSVVMDGSACTEAAKPGNFERAAPGFESLKATVKRCGGGCVMILFERTESRAQLAAMYTAADLFFNPTREDNYPTVNLESEACGTPVITYDTGGCAETIGFLDASRLVAGCDELLAALREMAGE